MEIMRKVKSFFVQSSRVWKLLRKPSAEEFKTVAKVSAIGILIVGAIGFIIADVARILSNLFS
ncbi:protein translocase SEC61 complex subunit gamma [Candidatus Pacearchaeota archaeon]|nr:MAG: protein translocase SEC61 complex subunit gamma [Candidatus Pacearchaeota archaeon]